MRREIKFRAKNKRTGGWEFFTLTQAGEFHDLIDWETIGQYFGLDDKQGHAMYDGDILKYHNNGRLSEPIEFPKDYPWLKARTEVRHWRTDVEVIGNIYENPGLLKSD
jgi:YopX protein